MGVVRVRVLSCFLLYSGMLNGHVPEGADKLSYDDSMLSYKLGEAASMAVTRVFSRKARPSSLELLTGRNYAGDSSDDVKEKPFQECIER